MIFNKSKIFKKLVKYNIFKSICSVAAHLMDYRFDPTCGKIMPYVLSKEKLENKFTFNYINLGRYRCLLCLL